MFPTTYVSFQGENYIVDTDDCKTMTDYHKLTDEVEHLNDVDEEQEMRRYRESGGGVQEDGLNSTTEYYNNNEDSEDTISMSITIPLTPPPPTNPNPPEISPRPESSVFDEDTEMEDSIIVRQRQMSQELQSISDERYADDIDFNGENNNDDIPEPQNDLPTIIESSEEEETNEIPAVPEPQNENSDGYTDSDIVINFPDDVLERFCEESTGTSTEDEVDSIETPENEEENIEIRSHLSLDEEFLEQVQGRNVNGYFLRRSRTQVVPEMNSDEFSEILREHEDELNSY